MASFFGAGFGSYLLNQHTTKINEKNYRRSQIMSMGEQFRIHETIIDKDTKPSTIELREGVEAFHCYCQYVMTNTACEQRYRYIVSGYLNTIKTYIQSLDLADIRIEWFNIWESVSTPQKVVLYAYCDYIFDGELIQMKANIKHDMLSELVHDIAYTSQPCYAHIVQTKWLEK